MLERRDNIELEQNKLVKKKRHGHSRGDHSGSYGPGIHRIVHLIAKHFYFSCQIVNTW